MRNRPLSESGLTSERHSSSTHPSNSSTIGVPAGSSQSDTSCSEDPCYKYATPEQPNPKEETPTMHAAPSRAPPQPSLQAHAIEAQAVQAPRPLDHAQLVEALLAGGRPPADVPLLARAHGVPEALARAVAAAPAALEAWAANRRDRARRSRVWRYAVVAVRLECVPRGYRHRCCAGCGA